MSGFLVLLITNIVLHRADEGQIEESRMNFVLHREVEGQLAKPIQEI
ncbi:hypothetical protein [Neobacillus endophyticus]|nr:hypothetical protein [Neobacillus endophyticus]